MFGKALLCGLACQTSLVAGQDMKSLRGPGSYGLKSQFDRKAFTDVFMGIADGFGLNLVETCLEDSLEFEQQAQAAITKFVTRKPVFGLCFG